MAARTRRHTAEPAAFQAAFGARLQALSRSHDVLVGADREEAPLCVPVESALASYAGEPGRITVEGPPVRPPQRRGFGSRLLERSLSPGMVHLEFNPDGLECRVSLPLGTSS